MASWDSMNGDGTSPTPAHIHDPKPFGDGEFGRCAACGDDTFPMTFDAAYGLPPGSFKLLCTQQAQSELLAALRHVWEGADRGELKALLVEAWGLSPSRVRAVCDRDNCGRPALHEGPCLPPSDLRGLAARESQR